ncbi:unnamed protein product [Mytilus edulis]|uniref:B box-type domain-containing protein n=1 Tax=Mytilus edulis TaxID=6550 RepID=A0A8S3V9V3_MYTED|nr:unnamed protein product [Mytilus edulis]
MATKGHILCGVCEVQDVTTVAEHWCPECDEGLCSSCLKYHTASKSSRNHDVISVDNYSKLPPSIASIKQHCPDHDKKFQNYCPQHESLCCPICISTVHRKCEVLAIDNIIKASKESSLLEQIETAIGNIKFNIDSVIQDREENLETIKNSDRNFKKRNLSCRKEIRQVISQDAVSRHQEKMAFTDFDSSRLIVLNDNGIFDFAMCLPTRPVDITCIDDKTVAISHSRPSNEIKIVDITTKQIVKTILKTSNQCCGISYCGKNLIYYEEGTGIKTVPVSGGRSYLLVKQTSNGFWNYITASREKIYQTCLQSNTLICFTMTGQKIWEYKDSVLAGPCGIATDSEGNIYVASRTNDSIVILSPDGKYARTILTKESGLRRILGFIYMKKESFYWSPTSVNQL